MYQKYLTFLIFPLLFKLLIFGKLVKIVLFFLNTQHIKAGNWDTFGIDVSKSKQHLVLVELPEKENVYAKVFP